jgi:hypothetical protein
MLLARRPQERPRALQFLVCWAEGSAEVQYHRRSDIQLQPETNKIWHLLARDHRIQGDRSARLL